MKVILDTHAFIWAAIGPGRLTPRVRDILENRHNQIVISAVSGYEIEFKRDRDPDLRLAPEDLQREVVARDIGWLPIGAAHAITAGRLPRIHGDPFDRILVAQTPVERAALIAADARIAPSRAPVIW